MSFASKAMLGTTVSAIVVWAAGFGMGEFFGIWPERIYFAIILWMCFNYQRYLELGGKAD